MNQLCDANKHFFQKADDWYYKQKIEENGLVVANKDIQYKMIFCSNCGETREIICADHRQAEEGG